MFKKLKDKKGFTLVELIVVLVILAILAALLVPALTGYIDKANNEKIIATTRQVVVAAQTEASEAYGKNSAGKLADADVTVLTVTSASASLPARTLLASLLTLMLRSRPVRLILAALSTLLILSSWQRLVPLVVIAPSLVRMALPLFLLRWLLLMARSPVLLSSRVARSAPTPQRPRTAQARTLLRSLVLNRVLV